MRSVRFMACVMSVASLTLTAGTPGAAAFPSSAASETVEASIPANVPVTRVQWVGYAGGFQEWEHIGWGGGEGYGDGFYGGYGPCCAPPPPPCCAPPPPCCLPPPPPPPPPCCERNYYAPPPYAPPPYGPLK